MKFGIRTPSFKKRLAARTSWKRYVRHNLGFKAPRGWGWLTNPKRAAYNRVYNRTTVSVDSLFKGPRRRRTSRHDGAALAVVAAVVIVAAFGAYLLVGAAVLLVAWLVRVATKKPAAATTPESVIPPPPPDAAYQMLLPPHPDGFANEEAARTAARNVFDVWLAPIPKAPRHGADLVRNINVRTRLIGRLTTQLVGRRFTWRSKPAPGKHVTTSPPVDPLSLDPWNPPPELAQRSHYFATCWSCNGAGRVACMPCDGTGRVGCGACGSTGKYYGTAANGSQRVLNCKSCKGKGSLACGRCTRGTQECATCQKMKKLECWLETEDHAREDVQVEPDGEITKAFSWGRDGVSATPDQIARDAIVVDGIDSTKQLTEADLPPTVPSDWKQEHWPRIQPRIDAGERIQRQSFRLLKVPSTEVTYSVLGHEQAVSFEGLRMLAPPPWADVLFARRATILSRVMIAVALLPLAALIIYAARGSYFISGRGSPSVVGVVGAAALVATCAYAVVWYATLGRRTARHIAYATAIPALAAAAFAFAAEPSVDRARSLVQAGDLEAAKAELSAIGPASDKSLVPVWADLHLREALSRTTCDDVAKLASSIPTSPEYNRAIAYADKLALDAAKEAFAAGNPEVASIRLQCASAATQQGDAAKSLFGQIAFEESARCVASKDWKCALTRIDEARRFVPAVQIESARADVLTAVRTDIDSRIASSKTQKDVSARLGTETVALAMWNDFLAPANGEQPKEIAQLSQAKTRDEQAFARQVEADKKRAELKEKQRLAAEERERKRQEAAERMRDYQPLVCNDGTLSPSCTCGGSHRGCCSHHGGVSGCRGD